MAALMPGGGISFSPREAREYERYTRGRPVFRRTPEPEMTSEQAQRRLDEKLAREVVRANKKRLNTLKTLQGKIRCGQKLTQHEQEQLEELS